MTHQKQTLASRVVGTDLVNWKGFSYIQQEDFKDFSEAARTRLRHSILTNQFTQPFYVWRDPGSLDLYCLDGRHRTLILEQLEAEGYDVPSQLPATFISCKDKKEAAELVLVYSSMYAKISQEGLFDFIQMYDLDFQDLKQSIDIPEFDELDFEAMLKLPADQEPVIPKSLQERFVVPPFSVFDTRQGYWQDRKKQWHALGFNSQATREDVELVAKSGQSPAIYELRNKMREALGRDPEWDEIIAEAKKKGLHIYEGASIFDPVLTEICYRWFVPDGGAILDPFAGGSVRGIVAGVLGYHYTGIDLRVEQTLANIEQIKNMNIDPKPKWVCGDSYEVLGSDLFSDKRFDFIFSCPPYHDLEKYSDDPADLSNMDYNEFLQAYRSIITKAMDKLKDNRFACFVVGDIRDKTGAYRNFVSDTIDCFTKCFDAEGRHVKLYNEIILVNVAGSLPIRIGRQFEGYRKVGKMHQNVLVFYKGDPKKIKEEFPQINMVEVLQELNYQPNIASSVLD